MTDIGSVTADADLLRRVVGCLREEAHAGEPLVLHGCCFRRLVAV